MLIQPASEAQEHLEVRGSSINNPIAQAAIWSFFKTRGDMVVIKVSFIKVRVRDLRILFELLAGPEPQ